MGTVQEPNLKQASPTKLTFAELNGWDAGNLLKWIHQERPGLLEGDNLGKFESKFINKDVFVENAGEVEFFENTCGLPYRISHSLAKLATEATGGKISGIKRSRQQAEDEDMSDIAVMERIRELVKGADMSNPNAKIALRILEFVDREIAGTKRNRQQAEGVDMSNAAKMKSFSKVLVTEHFKGGIKYKPPKPLIRSSGANWEFQSHEELYPKLATNVLTHYYNYKIDRIDKSAIPSFYFLGGAGTGKSRHGSEFPSSAQEAIQRLANSCKIAGHCASTNQHHISHCKRNAHLCDELLKRLRKAFVFLVSFEGTTPFENDDEGSPWKAIGVRMLHQLLDEPLSVIRRKYDVEPDDVFRLVAEAENVDLYNDFTGILVVDGAHQVSMSQHDWHNNKNSAFYSLLVRISALSLMARDLPEAEEGKEHRVAPFIMTCVTASYFGSAEYAFAKTGRYRVYLPLVRLKPPVWKLSRSRVFDASSFTKFLLNDAGGHARAMEIMADGLANVQPGLKPNFPEFANTLRDALWNHYRDAFILLKDYTLPLVQCILSRRQILLDDMVIPGSSLRWEDVTSSGLIWFAGTSRRGYLEAPYIWLWMISRMELERSNSAKFSASEDPDTTYIRQFLIDWKFNDYEYIYNRLVGKGDGPTWQSFEKFCCLFRILRSLGFGDGVMVPLATLHLGCKLRDDRKTMVVNRHLKFAEAKHQYRTDSIEGPNQYSDANSAEEVETENHGILKADAQLSHLIINGNSAQAGDFFFSIKTPPGEKIVREIGQCKFVKNTLSKKDYDSEWKKSAGKDDIFIVYAPKGVSPEVELLDRCGIVDDTCWKDYFGPFSGRAYLSLESSSKKRKTRGFSNPAWLQENGTGSGAVGERVEERFEW